MFQTKKGFITCSKLMVNEFGHCRLDQRISILLTINKHGLQSLLLRFVLHMSNII